MIQQAKGDRGSDAEANDDSSLIVKFRHRLIAGARAVARGVDLRHLRNILPIGRGPARGSPPATKSWTKY